MHAGLVLEPLPVGAWAMCCLCALLTTKAVTFEQAMSGLTSDSIWLIVIAFFFAKVKLQEGWKWDATGKHFEGWKGYALVQSRPA